MMSCSGSRGSMPVSGGCSRSSQMSGWAGLWHCLTVWRRYWRQRRQLAPAAYRPEEADFLPGALALQEKPLSPLPHVLVWLLMLLLVLALVWAFCGHIDIVATATGKVIPGGNSKVIQTDETALVRRIMVTEGQTVRAGEPLLFLDDTLVRADVVRLRSELAAAMADNIRAGVLLQALRTGGLPVRVRFPSLLTAVQQDETWRRIQGQYQAWREQQILAEAGIAQIRAQQEEAEAELQHLKALVPVNRTLAGDYRGLAQKHFVSRHDYLRQEQVRLDSVKQVAVQKARLATLKVSEKEAEAKKQCQMADYRQSLLELEQESQTRSEMTRQELEKAQEQERRMTLRSPVDGTVQQLAVHTVGGVVTAAQPLMVTVPENAPVEVEAFVENQDIGFIHPGQRVAVKIETFNYTRYGFISGTVKSVSRDAIEDEKRGLIYSVRITLSRNVMDIGGHPVAISPGMAVRAEIKTDRQRVVDYFLSPLKVYIDESLRER
ncbi:HlyD family type I secretion periplasmic adaptor subunit [Salmonella enterica subsp. enterica serovar Strasbourg]|uniref:Membrane fusion protein (MFP) family protein n=1 Tax=Salmonella enterica subsp. enterica serovar Strasbourg TaxID=682796 RepID=A0A5X7KA22_SALET|nr:HlyD family type I secretion periplasmic adaptor subunit [Salmonella enterica subsp. enterica serovar Strasbourg]